MPPRTGPPESRLRVAGFTLIEVLVALSLLALLTLMSWRGLDTLLRTAELTRSRSAALLGLQAGLAQWQIDLDQLEETPYVKALDWDGRLLRLVRRSVDGDGEALRVVAWSQRQAVGTDDAGAPIATPAWHWVRWQSAPLRQRASLLQAWQQAAAWGRAEPGRALDTDANAVSVIPLAAWQLLYFQRGQWQPAQAPSLAPSLAVGAAQGRVDDVPEGLRLVLSVPAGSPLQGRIESDWFKPLRGPVP